MSCDISGEIEKLFWCDTLILQFPLWWFSVPAIMKGWIDRVFVNGAVYGGGRRYDTGGLAGRRAMVVTSTAAYPDMCAADGLVGALDVILWPIQNGALAYAGCKVLPRSRISKPTSIRRLAGRSPVSMIFMTISEARRPIS